MRMKDLQFRFSVFFSAWFVGLLAANALADNYPAKPVKVIVAFAAGGSTDILGRLSAQALSSGLGQPFIVENRDGAGGNIGADNVAKSDPDGYTLLFTTTNVTLSPAIRKAVSYDVLRDLKPITQAAFAPLILVSSAGFQGKTPEDVVRYVKANPGKVSFSSSGVGGTPHLAGAMFNQIAGLDMVHVPYKGAAPALTDVVAGRVEFTFTTYTSAASFLKSGRLKAIGVASAHRLPLLPEVPTFNESGFDGFEVGTMFALFAPARTPQAVVRTLYQELAKAGKTPDFSEKVADLGANVVFDTPEAFADYVAKDVEKWKKVIKDIGFKPTD
jgi:tripartite-type tricarboxylate transporter receptor subunit TctC